ncbi:MAG: SRPBCC family protein [Flavobacteriales bacterium]
MAKEIKTQIVINASAEKVWKVLTNFSQYPEWNSFIKPITGEVNEGYTFAAHIHPPSGKAMKFKPKVLAFKENKEFRWLGHFLFKGLFDGEHKFELISNDDGSTTFIQSEKFTGILVPLFKTMLETNTVQGFNNMNAELKYRVEEN